MRLVDRRNGKPTQIKFPVTPKHIATIGRPMVASQTHCDPERLSKLLADKLPELEEARATDHVAHCSTCRAKLQQLAAEQNWWEEASDCLRGSQWNEDGTLWLTSQDFSRTGPAATEAAAEALDFLEPSDNPAMLGRLGEYEILSVLGSGGFGIVLKGYDGELNRYVAVKVLAPHLAHNAAARKRFAREAQAAAAVVHPHVVAIHAIDPAAKLPYLVMPLIAGESLQERLDRDGPLEAREILRIGLQVAQGLAAAHAQGVVHRDVKPANILLERGVDRVMLTDFGLARAMDDASQTRSMVIAGTPQYMSPEQAQGSAIDHRTDLFSLGSVMHAMCTGHPPFRAETLMGVLRRISDGLPRDVRQLNSDIPEWLALIIAKLHATDPANRFQSAAELADVLEHCLAHLQQPTLVDLPEYLRPQSNHRHFPTGWKPLAIAAGLLLCVLAVGGGLLWTNGPEKSQSNQRVSSQSSTTASVTPQPATAASAGDSDPLTWSDEVHQELWQLQQRLFYLEAVVERQ